MKRSLDQSLSKFDLKALVRLGARRIICIGLASAIFLHGAVIPAHSDTNLLPGAPQLYTVQPGDSLWSIATRFFREPWRWADILQRNPQISNPEQFFPGDLLVLDQGDADLQLKVLRVEKMSPRLRVVDQNRAVPSIAPDVIQPFLVSAEILQTAELPDSGYVVAGTQGETTLGQFAWFYARDLPYSSAGDYHVMRFGERFIDPDSGEYLGRSVIRIGTAKGLQPSRGRGRRPSCSGEGGCWVALFLPAYTPGESTRSYCGDSNRGSRGGPVFSGYGFCRQRGWSTARRCVAGYSSSHCQRFSGREAG